MNPYSPQFKSSAVYAFRISHLPQSHRNHPPLAEVPAARGWLIERVVENSHSTQTKNTYIFDLYMLFQPTFIHNFQHTLPETNTSPLKMDLLPQKETSIYIYILNWSIFRCEKPLVSGSRVFFQFPPPPSYPQEIAGLVKGLLTIGFPYIIRPAIYPLFLGGVLLPWSTH